MVNICQHICNYHRCSTSTDFPHYSYPPSTLSLATEASMSCSTSAVMQHWAWWKLGNATTDLSLIPRQPVQDLSQQDPKMQYPLYQNLPWDKLFDEILIIITINIWRLREGVQYHGTLWHRGHGIPRSEQSNMPAYIQTVSWGNQENYSIKREGRWQAGHSLLFL
jgi:hypothetical protein